MNAEWYYQTGGRTLGPVDAQQLKALAASGSLKPTDQVRKGEPPNQWAKASAVKGLFPERPAALPPKPAIEDDFLDTVIHSQPSPEDDGSSSFNYEPMPSDSAIPYSQPKNPVFERRDFPTLRFYARLASGVGTFTLWLGLLAFIGGIAGVVLTQEGALAAVGVVVAVFCLAIALACFLIAEVVRLGLYYATLLEDIRNRL